MTDKNNNLVPVQDNAEALIAKAIENNVPVETMEKLLAMRRELKAEYAKEQFDNAMAAFQAECPTIEKTKKVYEKDKRSVRYSYAPLESIVEQVKDLLAKHGFSYSINTVQDDKMLGVICKATHKYGHSESTTFSVPIGSEGFMSDVQKYGARLTFAKRYAFCNAFGILTGDEDNDASPQALTPRQMADKKDMDEALDGETEEKPNGNGAYKPTQKQLDFIKRLITQKGLTKTQMNELLDSYNITAFGQLTGVQASQLIEQLLAIDDK